MPGPLPKDPKTRQRRNRAATATQLQPVPAVTDTPPLPPLRDWHPQTQAWWQDAFRSPMAGEYLPADVHGLARVAVLVDDYWTAETSAQRARLSAEIRLAAQGYGLSPIDRRRLQWEVQRAEAPVAPKRKARSSAKDDPRLRLAR
jgi:hypothetical protein